MSRLTIHKRSLIPNQYERYSARRRVSYALKTGKLVREPCDVCGDLKVEGHHPNYREPLAVLWLCRPHHMELHKYQKTLAF